MEMQLKEGTSSVREGEVVPAAGADHPWKIYLICSWMVRGAIKVMICNGEQQSIQMWLSKKCALSPNRQFSLQTLAGETGEGNNWFLDILVVALFMKT